MLSRVFCVISLIKDKNPNIPYRKAKPSPEYPLSQPEDTVPYDLYNKNSSIKSLVSSLFQY